MAPGNAMYSVGLVRLLAGMRSSKRYLLHALISIHLLARICHDHNLTFAVVFIRSSLSGVYSEKLGSVTGTHSWGFSLLSFFDYHSYIILP